MYQYLHEKFKPNNMTRKGCAIKSKRDLEIKSLKDDVRIMQGSFSAQQAAVMDYLREARKAHQGIEQRVEHYGRKKAKELSAVQESAIRKLNQLIKIFDLKVVKGEIVK